MDSIAVTRPHMAVLSQGKLPLTPFGALAQAFAEEVLARAELEEGTALLEELAHLRPHTVYLEDAAAGVADALEAAVERHNAYAVQSGEPERFVTATVLCVRRGGDVRAVNCGHLAPCLLHPDGRVEAVGLPAGVPLGLAALTGEPRTVERFALPEGGVLVLLTDGITEAQDASGAFYPAEQGLAELAGTPAAELPGALDGCARRWSGGRSRDHVTVLVLRPAR